MLSRLRWNIAGISVRIHPLFWLLIGLGALAGRFWELLVLFGILGIHELGHAFMARALLWKVESVELLPFGGVARMDQSREVPLYQEFLVVMAGPLMNLLMAPLAYLMYSAGWWDVYWAQYFVMVNLLLAGFNLLPIYPLDGGRLVGLLLLAVQPYLRAIRLRVYSGILGALALLVIAVSNPFSQGSSGLQLNLFVIGLFLLLHNHRERGSLPYQWLQFLSRRHGLHQKGEVPSYPSLSFSFGLHQTPEQLLRRMHAGKVHWFHTAAPDCGSFLLNEREVLRLFFEGGPVQKTMRSWLC